MGGVMNLVVLTAALSSLNSGLYSTGRVLRTMALDGAAPRYLARMNRQSVPSAAILTTVAIYLVGVGLNYFLPAQIFEIVLNMASLGVISTWCFILVCQMKLRQAIVAGRIAPTSFAMPGAPYTTWATLVFFLGILALMAFDYPTGTYSIAAVPVLALLLVAGWKLMGGRPLPIEPQTEFSAILTDAAPPAQTHPLRMGSTRYEPESEYSGLRQSAVSERYDRSHWWVCRAGPSGQGGAVVYGVSGFPFRAFVQKRHVSARTLHVLRGAVWHDRPA